MCKINLTWVIIMDVAITKMSSKGQIVVPKTLREQIGADEHSTFAVFGRDDTIILKKVDVPDAREVFEDLNRWGRSLAKKKGWKEQDVVKKIKKGRGIRNA